MNYNPEIHFLDEHYATLLEALACNVQFVNTYGCLRLLTDAANIIGKIESGTDKHINARLLLCALRKFLLTCWVEVERQRCINVLLISLYNVPIKDALCELWKDKCYSHSCKDEKVSNPLYTIFPFSKYPL